MSGTGEKLTVAALFAERDARRQHDREADEQLQRKRNEELANFGGGWITFSSPMPSSSREWTGSGEPSNVVRRSC
jgi:hypothetical protein